MRNLNTSLANGRLELRIKFELEFRPKFYLKTAPLKHEFTSHYPYRFDANRGFKTD